MLIGKVANCIEIISPIRDEKSTSLEPYYMVQEIARGKAEEILEKRPDNTIIGSDTIVVLDGKVLGKPKTKEEAYNMLKSLSNRMHNVYTGVCIADKSHKDCFTVESQVVFYELNDKQIKDYIATGSPFDKAGGYGIQDSGFVKEIIGSYDNVMGLPTEEIELHLNKQI